MEQSEELEAALNRRFFPYVESMGFIRDERQRPRMTCLRRKTDSAVQIFAVLWAPTGRSRFRILFAEAPLAGIDYGGKHLPPEDIYPGNFALARGWLRSSPGRHWFGADQPWWWRLVSKRQTDPDHVVRETMDLFPKIVAWWETKQPDPHLLVLLSRAPPEMPTHAPVFGHPVKPSRLQRFFAKDYVWTIGFFGIAVCFAATLAVQASPDWTQMFILLFAGAVGGAMLSWILLQIVWRIRGWINGGPFRKGDLVQVISGAHAGKIAAVYEEWPSRNQVRIDLDHAAWEDVKDVFSSVQLCRVKKEEPAATTKTDPLS